VYKSCLLALEKDGTGSGLHQGRDPLTQSKQQLRHDLIEPDAIDTLTKLFSISSLAGNQHPTTRKLLQWVTRGKGGLKSLLHPVAGNESLMLIRFVWTF